MRDALRPAALTLAALTLFSAVGVAAIPRFDLDVPVEERGPVQLTPPPPPEEPGAGTWRTWFLESPSELRLAPPPYDATAEELAELQEMRLARTPLRMSAAQHWDFGPAGVPWERTHLEALARHPVGPPMAARNLAILSLAIYDASVAAWDSKLYHNREGPESLDPTLPALPLRGTPSYPSEHAVVAGAASEVLAWLYPDEAQSFRDLGRSAAELRLHAGMAYRSDVEAGLALGQAVAARAIAARADDGATAGAGQYTGAIPTGPCTWTPTPPGYATPFGVVWGSVKPFLMTRGDQFRAPPPPECESPEYVGDHLKVYELSLTSTDEEKEWATWWHDHDGLQVAGIFTPMAIDWILADHLSTPKAARVLALAHAAMSDAFVSVWESKYVYWTERPVHVIRRHFDPDWNPLIDTPPFPGYPSGHSAQGGSVGDVLAHFFPDRAVLARRWGWDDAHAREYAGVHPWFDDEQGRVQGKQVAGLFVAWDRAR